MAKMNFKDALNKSLQATKKYVDDQITENKFSGDYNDLENRPCYEDNVIKHYSYIGNDGTEKELVPGNLINLASPLIKITEDVPTYDAMMNDLIYEESVDGEYYQLNIKDMIESGEYSMYDIIDIHENETGKIACIFASVVIVFNDGYISDKFVLDQPIAYEKGIYLVYIDDDTRHIDIHVPIPTIKQLDEKFIPFETEEETLNRFLEAGLILGAVELEDDSILTDNDGNLIIF